MAMNSKRIIRIILEEVSAVDDRCPGYREELVHTIGDIIAYERKHRIQGIRIQQLIDEKCKATGQYLAKQLGKKWSST
jgi:hypothetical protein